MERGAFPHLSDAEYEALTKMTFILGPADMQAVLHSEHALQRERIGHYMAYENALLEQVRGAMMAQFEHESQSAVTQAQNEMRSALTAQFEQQANEAIAQARAEATRTTSSLRPVMLSVPSFSGKEEENLLFWFKEVELAFEAALIVRDRVQVAFAMSKLAGRAKNWVLAKESTTPGAFPNWEQLKADLVKTFLPPNAAFRQRSKFLACKQGKKELHEYVQELRVLVAKMASDPLPEAVKITVFMEGLRPGPSKTQLFRTSPQTLEEAFEVATQEDYCHRQSRHSTSAAPTPMDLSGAESMRCFGCGKVGHMRRECPRRFSQSAKRDKRVGWSKPPTRAGNAPSQ